MILIALEVPRAAAKARSLLISRNRRTRSSSQVTRPLITSERFAIRIHLNHGATLFMVLLTVILIIQDRIDQDCKPLLERRDNSPSLTSLDNERTQARVLAAKDNPRMTTARIFRGAEPVSFAVPKPHSTRGC